MSYHISEKSVGSSSDKISINFATNRILMQQVPRAPPDSCTALYPQESPRAGNLHHPIAALAVLLGAGAKPLQRGTVRAAHAKLFFPLPAENSLRIPLPMKGS